MAQYWVKIDLDLDQDFSPTQPTHDYFTPLTALGSPVPNAWGPPVIGPFIRDHSYAFVDHQFPPDGTSREWLTLDFSVAEVRLAGLTGGFTPRKLIGPTISWDRTSFTGDHLHYEFADWKWFKLSINEPVIERPQDVAPFEHWFPALMNAISQTGLAVLDELSHWMDGLDRSVLDVDAFDSPLPGEVERGLIKNIGRFVAYADVGFRVNRILDAEDSRRQGFIETVDLVLSVAVTAGATVGSGPAGGAAASLIYTHALSEWVRMTAGEVYSLANPSPPLRQQKAGVPDFAVFDAEWYLDQHSDARDALVSGTASSAYDHYLKVGILRGDLPSEGSRLVRIEDLAFDVDRRPNAEAIAEMTGVDRTVAIAEASRYQTDAFGVGTAGRDVVTDNAEAIDLGAGNDVLTSRGRATYVDLSAGNDKLVVRALHDLGDAMEFAAKFVGGPGRDRIDFGSLDVGRVNRLEVDLLEGSAVVWQQSASGDREVPVSGTALVEFEDVTGSSRGDVIWGNAAGNRLNGGGGADEISGRGGKDRLLGNVGNDGLYGGTGADRLIGGTGNDKLVGGAGADRLFGGVGNDKLVGGAGADIMTGGPGRDIMNGGGGDDRFVFLSVSDSRSGSAHDVIRGFVRGEDLIDIAAIDAIQGRSGNQTFHYVGSATFSGERGELHYRGGILSGDVNGDRLPDFEIALDAVLLGTDDMLL